MRRQRRISEFGEAEFLSALFHNALRRLEGRALEVLTFPPRRNSKGARRKAVTKKESALQIRADYVIL